jgi:NADPH:quinone reductase-like Zn-dependent oxidoreductase
VGTNYITAYLGLIEKAALKEGETVLVTGAGGGVGSSVIKIAKTRAARVIAVDRQAPDKARLPGIDLGLGSDSDDIARRVMEFTGGRGADIAFDCVGGPLFETALNTLGKDGRQVNITAVGERRVSFDLLDFYRRQLTLFGVNTAFLDTVAAGHILDAIRPDFEERRLTPPRIARTCTLSEAVQAYADVGSGAAKGKIVIIFTE